MEGCTAGSVVQLLQGNLTSTFLRLADTFRCGANKARRRIYIYGSRYYRVQPIFSRRCKRRPATFSLLEVEPQFIDYFDAVVFQPVSPAISAHGLKNPLADFVLHGRTGKLPGIIAVHAAGPLTVKAVANPRRFL